MAAKISCQSTIKSLISLAGHPEDSEVQIAVDGRRGYLTCLCTRSEGEAVAMVWDLHSGRSSQCQCLPETSSLESLKNVLVQLKSTCE